MRSRGTARREITFSRNLWIEADDFLEDTGRPSTKRLYPGGTEVPPARAHIVVTLHRLRKG